MSYRPSNHANHEGGTMPPRRRSIALIGMRGSGKSSVGRAVASCIKVPYIDTDEMIVCSAGQSIADLFRDEGEAGFRAREREAIAEAIQLVPAVISVGGGAVLDPVNVERLRSVATIVWLTAPADVLWRRISGDPTTAASRPSLTSLPGPDEVARLLDERASFYARAADLTVNTESMPIDQVAQWIVENA